MKRLEWLKSHTPPPAPHRANFRTSESRTPALRAPEAPPKKIPSAEAPAAVAPAPEAPTPTPPPPAKTPISTASTREGPAPAVRNSPSPAPKKRTAEAPAPPPHAPIAEGPKPSGKISPPAGTPPPPASPKNRLAEASTPTPRAPVAAAPKTAKIVSLPTATPPPPTPPPAKPRSVEPKTIAARSTPLPRAAEESRYPWKTRIVTTVFWIGEPVSGHNFTHNFSSSWDANWAHSYGGFDNPNPAARRRYIPVKFTPRQNPFYLALPYNDVTRGTTKPEARAVIPWFNEAFRGEGESVCRDRWVAVRNRAGKIGYAQWSDCGPFRTDHWQYVFGKEKPKPNLNQGAGLDVSPALRDYLGLQSTDLTDWKFVDFKDIPNGPWSLYGENNTFTQKSAPPPRRVGKANAPSSSDVLARNP